MIGGVLATSAALQRDADPGKALVVVGGVISSLRG